MTRISAGVVAFCLLGIPIRSAAQEAQSPWEIEFHGGGLFSSLSDDGTGRLPDPGAVFTTLIGTPSRRVSSWYFGDGALLMNQVTLILGGGGPRITPLDPALIESRLDRDAGGTIGFRLSRRLNNRLRAEFSLDYGLAQLALQREAIAAITASRDSFVTAFGRILIGPFGGSPATSNATIEESRGNDIVTTGALNILLLTQGRVIPFVTFGGGVISNTGGSPEFSLQGDYTVRPIGFTGQITQRDRVDVRYTVRDHAPVGLVGFGVRYAVSERWVLRFEGRGLFSESTVEVKVDAAPQSSATGGAFAFGLVSSPTVQFSTIPISPSSLSGPAIADFVTFSGSGLNRQFSLTAGLGWRF